MNEKTGELNKLLAAVPPEIDVQQRQDAWRQASVVTAKCDSELRSAQRRVKDIEKSIADCDAQKIQQAAALEDLKRQAPAGVCGVPIGDACEAGKRHHANRPTAAAYAAVLKGIEETRIQMGRDLDTAREENRRFRRWDPPTPYMLSEGRRLFYVGVTRAKHAVHLVHSDQFEGRFGVVRLGPSRFVKEINERLKDR